MAFCFGWRGPAMGLACLLFAARAGVSMENTVTFDNQSGEPALVKLALAAGAMVQQVEVPNGARRTVDAAAGRYIMKARYGTPGGYRYSKGQEFEVKQTATTRSATTITLHKVVGGNYGTQPISAAEFGDTEEKKDSGPPSPESKQRRPETVTPPLSEPRVLASGPQAATAPAAKPIVAPARSSAAGAAVPSAAPGRAILDWVLDKGQVDGLIKVTAPSDGPCFTYLVLLKRPVRLDELKARFGPPARVEKNQALIRSLARTPPEPCEHWYYGQARVAIAGDKVEEIHSNSSPGP